MFHAAYSHRLVTQVPPAQDEKDQENSRYRQSQAPGSLAIVSFHSHVVVETVGSKISQFLRNK